MNAFSGHYSAEEAIGGRLPITKTLYHLMQAETHQGFKDKFLTKVAMAEAITEVCI